MHRMFCETPNPNLTFDNFVTGESNRLAYSLCNKIAEEPCVYKPLCIYGGAGLGKSHLLHAVANKIIRRRILDPEKVCLCNTYGFINEVIDINELINPRRYECLNDFLNYFKGLDFFLVDCVQLLWKKASTRDAFLKVIDALLQKGARIVVTTDILPGYIMEYDERIRSFFEQAFLAEIKLPEIDLKKSVLKNKATEENITINDDALHFLATIKTDNIRLLLKVLMRSKQHILEQVLSLDLAQEIIRAHSGDLFEGEREMHPGIRQFCEMYFEPFRNLEGSHKLNWEITTAKSYMRETDEKIGEELFNYLIKEYPHKEGEIVVKRAEVWRALGKDDHAYWEYKRALKLFPLDSEERKKLRFELEYLDVWMRLKNVLPTVRLTSIEKNDKR